MATGDSPASARRRLRHALRRSRDAAGLTQGDVKDALHWSLSKVQRIEAGEVTISITDLEALLRLLAVDDPVQVGRLRDDARLARQRGWWSEPQYRAHLTPAMLQIIQFEQSAAAIRVFQPALFPGLLQDETYAAAIFGATVENLSAEARHIRLEVRMRRRQDVWSRASPPQYLVILDELMLRRVMGDLAVTARQFQAVLEMMRQRPEIVVRLLPKDQALSLLSGAFSVYDFDEEGDAALYREFSVTDEVNQDPAEIKKFRLRFEQMWDICLSPEATLNAMEARYADHRAQLSRRE